MKTLRRCVTSARFATFLLFGKVQLSWWTAWAFRLVIAQIFDPPTSNTAERFGDVATIFGGWKTCLLFCGRTQHQRRSRTNDLNPCFPDVLVYTLQSAPLFMMYCDHLLHEQETIAEKLIPWSSLCPSLFTRTSSPPPHSIIIIRIASTLADSIVSYGELHLICKPRTSSR